MIDQDRPRINWDRIGPRTAVWCATEEEASEFVRAAHERGCHWAGSVPDGCLCRGAGRDTVYYIRDGRLMWSSRSAATSYVDAVVNFSDLLEAASGEAQDGRPCICEVLGVEVGERFTYPGMIGEFWVTKNGHLRSVVDGEEDLMTCVPALINHPDRIIRKPRFSEEEVAVLRHFVSTGVKRIKKGQNGGTMIWDAVGVGGSMSIPDGFLPSLRTGQSIALEEIIG